jgi:hypothetical protein
MKFLYGIRNIRPASWKSLKKGPVKQGICLTRIDQYLLLENFGKWCHKALLDLVAGARLSAFLTAFALSTFIGIPNAISSEVHIKGLSDLNFGNWNGVNDLVGNIKHCVRSTAPGAWFSLEALGEGPGGSYALLNGKSNLLPMHISYNDGRGWADFAPGTPLLNLKGVRNAHQFDRCLSGRRIQNDIRIQILSQDIGTALGGRYSGTLTLFVIPQ